MLTLEIMQRRWPNGDQHIPGLLEGIVAAAPTVFPKYGLLSPLVVAHAMAQFSEECGQGLEMIENLSDPATELWQAISDLKQNSVNRPARVEVYLSI